MEDKTLAILTSLKFSQTTIPLVTITIVLKFLINMCQTVNTMFTLHAKALLKLG